MENDTQVREERTVALCCAFGGLAIIRLISYTLSVSVQFR